MTSFVKSRGKYFYRSQELVSLNLEKLLDLQKSMFKLSECNFTIMGQIASMFTKLNSKYWLFYHHLIQFEQPTGNKIL